MKQGPEGPMRPIALDPDTIGFRNVMTMTFLKIDILQHNEGRI